ncbi:GDP-mannose-dependent alpha-(1-6)-phosphatidylinositol monomannoside mannosyltransferase [Planctomycetes bacterium Pla163]|uniref:GDP-mannose-dependent alpha-(1-6)-phosphatidylinositol monomannoside mannosyltransferase n=1 Tax=Rohdeia mirabilis TaxID=2528008 RepID=A0A518D2C0_9BACT|nr:GDP-mannose-dependent alpha-(1-6)-phosphatidylinositol monomannoside mannosyltransferase [Planctomycetes bacterium Pla163]
MSPGGQSERPRATVGIDYRPALHNREGIGRVARELVRALGELGDEAPRLALFGGSLRPPRVGPDELGLPTGARLVAPRLPARLTGPLLRLCGGADRVLGADLVHLTQLRPLPARRAPTCQMVFDVLYADGGHGWLDPQVARQMEARLRASLPRLERVQVTSGWVRDELVRRGWFDAERIDLVPLGGDHVARPLAGGGADADAARLPTEPFLLTVSRLDPRKGHDLALRAFERLVARGFDGRWIVAGPPGYRADELWSAIRASPVAERVEWRRSVDEHELRALYEGCLAFVFPSRAEGFGLPPIEAMWAGAPVVSSRATCLAEVVGTGADTFDPEAADGVDELVDHLERVVSDASWRAALVERGRAWRERYSWTACARASIASWNAALAR